MLSLGKGQYVFLVWTKLGDSNLKFWKFFSIILNSGKKMRGVLTDYGVGKMRFQLSDFTSFYSGFSVRIVCDNSSEFAFLGDPHLWEPDFGFFYEPGAWSDHSGGLCVPPKGISI